MIKRNLRKPLRHQVLESLSSFSPRDYVTDLPINKFDYGLRWEIGTVVKAVVSLLPNVIDCDLCRQHFDR
ncbi:unnamed protein product [Brassica rapa subsp. trilocularis]